MTDNTTAARDAATHAARVAAGEARLAALTPAERAAELDGIRARIAAHDALALHDAHCHARMEPFDPLATGAQLGAAIEAIRATGAPIGRFRLSVLLQRTEFTRRGLLVLCGRGYLIRTPEMADA